jgi:hypothetical protein
MARPMYRIESYCVVDRQPIPSERIAKGSVTCSKECAAVRRKAQRTLQDERECRYCSRPSTPEERDAFRRFRRLEAKRPDLLYPQAFEDFTKQCEVDGTDATPQAFAKVYAKGLEETNEAGI